MGRSIVLIYSEDGADNPEYRGLELNRGCPFIEKASATLLVSAIHSANTAADNTSLIMRYEVLERSVKMITTKKILF